MKRTAVVIGGGLGGLFTGAILSKEGIGVTVLEKNATAGGGLQSFRRFGELFDTGMHVVGGMHRGGNVRCILNYLGILDKVRVMDVDDACTDRLYFSEDGHSYSIAKGRKGFVDSLSRYFPQERENLERYVDALFSMTEQVDLFNLRPSDGRLSLFSGGGDFLLPANQFIANFVSDPRLRSVLAYMNPLYGGRADHTPAYVHVIISTLYINGASRFIGGSSHLADLLSDVITANGGRVLVNECVEHIDVANREVLGVATTSGHRYTADFYVSAIHPCTMFRLLDDGALPKAYRSRLDSIPNAHSAFSLYIKLKPRSFRYINHSEYYMSRYSDVWHFSDVSRPWPLGLLFMTPPEECNASGESVWATKALVTAPMPFCMVERWEHTTVGRRGADYEAWKQARSEELLSMIEEMHPGFASCIEAMNTSSPLTIRDFYGVKDGSICGFSKDSANIALSQVPVVTKISNLLLTGQNCNLHGFCGVPLTAINTCEAILGLNHVINKINECRES